MDGSTQRLLFLVGLADVLQEIIELHWGEDSGVMAEGREVVVVGQQLFGLSARTIIEGVDEIEGDVSGNQVELGRAVFGLDTHRVELTNALRDLLYNPLNALDKLLSAELALL